MGENSKTSEQCESRLLTNAGNGYELQHAGARERYVVPGTGSPMTLCRLHADMLGDAVLSVAAGTANDDVNALVDRIVRRAQYTALREVLDVLDTAVASVRVRCRKSHGPARGHDDGRECGLDFEVSDFRAMLNDAARNLGTALPVTVTDE